MKPLILGIETSCDETAVRWCRGPAALHVLSSQVDGHARFGGVVPEVAARAHIEAIRPLVHEALRRPVSTRRRSMPSPPPAAPGWSGRSGRRRSASPRPSPGASTSRSSASTTWRGTCSPPASSTPGTATRRRAARLRWAQPDRPRPRVGPTTRSWGSHHRRRRRRGVRQAGPVTWVSAIPGGPAIDRCLRAVATRLRSTFPRALRDRPFDLSFSGLKTSVVPHS